MIPMATPRIFELDCQAMNYDWGKPGSRSLVAQLLPGQSIDHSLPYAELWMGIHPNAPSRVKFGNGELLSEVLTKNRKLLGAHTMKRWGTLPFLFKVLSIAEPLSIQMHPDKSWAESLHSDDPQHYPDPNHKPEIALAISGVETLFGFENEQKVIQVLKRYPILQEFCGEEVLNSSEGKKRHPHLEDLFPVLLNLPEKRGEMLLQRLFQQVQKEVNRTEKEELFLSLFPQYRRDLGLLFLFFMQKMPIAPQTSLFLKANRLHAYLSGDLVECMANSDNVIRAGITNKFKDVEQMLSRLNYRGEPARLCAGISHSNCITKYPCDAEEFILETIELPHHKLFRQQKTKSPSILLTLSGRGQLESEMAGFELCKGTVLFIGANQPYTVESNQQLQLVRASVPVL
ncbi:MAG: mannose-6-phosphate isomerase, class I [SAR324 cluster bacterium]|nr:mannose-6-phosphate isomerase, class I [SAR324 cluster bacterium]